MFFNNKKSKEKEDENIKEETLKENFVISDYAMERYKKSEHYKYDELIDKEIELLFCDKENWDESLNEKQEEVFYNALNKLKGSFQGIIFLNFRIENITEHPHFLFRDCTFYNYSSFSEYENSSYKFFNCILNNNTDYPKNDTMIIKTNKEIHLEKIRTKGIFSIYNCSDLFIYGCNGKIFLGDFKINKIRISNTIFNNLYLKNMNIKYFDLSNCEGICEFRDVNEIEKCHFDRLKSDSITGYYTKITNCNISGSEIGRAGFNSKSLENSMCNIRSSKINQIDISYINKITFSFNTFEYINILGLNEYLFIEKSTISSCNLNKLENKNICILNENIFEKVDFKFASINKLAIYKSSFKELDFDCSFINEARFVQVKGLDEENKEEELSDKHFASKESLNYFKTITNEKE